MMTSRLTKLARKFTLLLTKSASDQDKFLLILQGLVKLTQSTDIGMASLPKLVDMLNIPLSDVHAGLMRAYREGLIELRPESGMGRLNKEQLAKCIKGPQGTHLSWIRIIDVATVAQIIDEVSPDTERGGDVVSDEAYQAGLEQGEHDLEYDNWDLETAWRGIMEDKEAGNFEPWMDDYSGFELGYLDAKLNKK